jgi:hypothetical protein
MAHRVLVVEYPGRVLEVSREGELLWEYQAPALAIMAQPLFNGNVFIPVASSPPRAIEVNREKQIVWEYESSSTEILGGERLSNGMTLLGEQGPPRVLEVNQAKAVQRSIPVPTSVQEAHRQLRRIHGLSNGNVLVAIEGEGFVRELDASGAVVWEYGGLDSVHDAVRLENGNTLIGGGQSKRVLEVNSQKQVVWELNSEQAPELGLTWITNVQSLPNGNVLFCNWVGGDGGAGVHAAEVTPDKQVVWTLDDHALIKSATSVVVFD